MEENNKNKSKGKKVCKILGPILLGVSSALIISGICTFSMIRIPILFMLGMMCLPAGFVVTMIGYLHSIHKGLASSVIQIQKDIITENKDDLTEMASASADINEPFVRKTAAAAREGWKGETKSTHCNNCGAQINDEQKYCSYCGNKLK